jgi:hypothetical protein
MMILIVLSPKSLMLLSIRQTKAMMECKTNSLVEDHQVRLVVTTLTWATIWLTKEHLSNLAMVPSV